MLIRRTGRKLANLRLFVCKCVICTDVTHLPYAGFNHHMLPHLSFPFVHRIYDHNCLGSSYAIDFFPTCQVSVVRFYVSCLLLLSSPLLSSPLLFSPLLSCPLLLLFSSFATAILEAPCSLSDLNHDPRRTVLYVGLNHAYPRPVFPAGRQPRPPCLVFAA